jgi:WD40 repeat protein
MSIFICKLDSTLIDLMMASLSVSASQPVFNRDRFLRQAPALFEDKRPSVLIQSNYSDSTSKILSPRSKRFLSVLVNSQHFHQLLERLSSKETAFFHEVMEAIEPEDDAAAVTKNYFSTNFGTPDLDELANKLYDSLEAIEQKIPTYRVDRKPRPPGIIRWQDEEGEEFKINYDCDLRINDAFWFEDEDKTPSIAFTFHILKPIMDEGQNSASTSGNVHALSLEYLVELEKNPWRYSNMLQIPACATDENDTKEGEQKVEFIEIRKKIKLRDAIGERRFRAWKIANDHKDDDEILNTPLIEKSSIDKTFDLSAILANLPEPPLEGASSTQPHVDANDRDKVRRCLEIAFGSSQNSASFNENGRDLIMEAESALRNPSAQRYLFSVLSQRNKIEKQRSKEDPKQRAASQQSVSRLEQGAFNCVVRLCIAVLEACMEEEDFESAYKLLSLTGGFCTITVGNQADYTPTYMTEMIKAHSIFADLRLWERVLLLHKEQQNDRKEDEPSNAASDGEEERHTDAAEAENTAAYDAAVSTLYEMVGYGVAAEELARFSTRISEERGWFACDKGQSLLVLARRLTAKRDEDGEKTGEAGDFDLTKGNLTHTFERKNSHPLDVATIYEEEKAFVSEVIAWSHPSVSLHSSDRFTGARAFLGNILGAAGETAAAASVPHQHEEMKETNINNVFNAGGYAGRVAVTAVATFGSTAVVTGGVDGSVFLAHTVHFGAENSEHESNCSSRPSCASPLHSKSSLINGVKLQWGSSGDNDVDCVTGSVSCLTVSKGSGYRVGNAANSVDASGCADEDEIISSMEGCRIIGGTTCGGLRMWSLKDIYQARIMSQIGVGADHSSLGSRSHQGSGVNSITSTLVRHNDDYGLQEAVKGISIGGHRGGVTCIDIPPRMYRPDALLSGGEDGLIKLWSLKSSSSGADGVHNSPSSSIQSRFFANRQIATVPTDYDTSDAQGVLAGHEGRIICIKTAWHGDKLLSGGADKTIRLWDLSGSTKPLSKL